MEKINLLNFDFKFTQWDEIPEWVEWVAQDISGKYHGFSAKPVKNTINKQNGIGSWELPESSDGVFINLSEPTDANYNWQFTLQQRPKVDKNNTENPVSQIYEIRWVLANIATFPLYLFKSEENSLMRFFVDGSESINTDNIDEAIYFNSFQQAYEFIKERGAIENRFAWQSYFPYRYIILKT